MKRWLAFLLLLVSPAACQREAARVTRIGGATMGTTYSVQVVDLPLALDPRSLHARLDGALRAIERMMSTYDPESELSSFNASGSTDWFPVSAGTAAVVDQALRVSRLTDGAFDVTVGPLVDLWGFGPSGERGRPAPDAIATALASVGFGLLEARASPASIRKRIPDLHIDLSAIAKGFAVDELARLLGDEGARDFLVEVGGELRASGCNADGEPWRIAVERPGPLGDAPPCLLRLNDVAVATSGDYRIGFEEDGVRYTHVIDPRTGRPVATGVASATVIAPSAIEADAFATAAMVLSPDDALLLAEREGLALRLLVRADASFVERKTPQFPARVRRGRVH